MGMQDRDYYREWWAKKEGYVEKTAFRLPAKKPRTKVAEWHPIFTIFLTLVICVFVYGAVILIVKLSPFLLHFLKTV